MHNRRGGVGWNILIVVVALLIMVAAAWLFVGRGWQGSIPATLDRLKADISGQQPEPEEDMLPMLSSPKMVPTPEPTENARESTPFLNPESGMAEPAFPPTLGASGDSATSAQTPTGDAGSPTDILKSCLERLRQDDTIGAERYVSDYGLRFTIEHTTGVHEILWKGMFKMRAFGRIGYDKSQEVGRTAWIPIYASGQGATIISYIVMANRGDGWKLDHISDPSRF